MWRIVNGKIKEEWSAFDQLSMMKQLGLLDQKENGAGATGTPDKKKE
jgi:hypothetical protein